MRIVIQMVLLFRPLLPFSRSAVYLTSRSVKIDELSGPLFAHFNAE